MQKVGGIGEFMVYQGGDTSCQGGHHRHMLRPAHGDQVVTWLKPIGGGRQTGMMFKGK